MKKFHFLAGLPRSGSTVLSKIICQHPELFCSSTSPLLEYMQPAAMQLHMIKNDHSYGHIIDIPLILNQTASSFFSFTSKPIVVDKNRGWVNSYNAVKQDFVSDPKTIITLRPIDQVITSFHHIFVKNDRKHTPEEIFRGYVATVYEPLMQFSEYKSEALILTYNDIVYRPKQTMKKVEKYFNLYHHEYDFNNIKDESPEDDSKWGLEGLHTIRQTLSLDKKNPSDIMTKTELKFCQEMTRKLYNAFEIEED